MPIAKKIIKKNFIKFFIILNFTFFIFAVNAKKSQDFVNENDRVSYTIGYKVAQGFMSLNIKFNAADLKRGIGKIYDSTKKVTAKERNQYIKLTSKLMSKNQKLILSKKQKKKLSFLLGKIIAERLNQFNYSFLNKYFVKKGATDILTHSTIQLTKMQMASALKSLNRKINKEKENESNINVNLGETFLTKNKNAPGIKITKSRLQYKVLREGTIESKPTIRSVVQVHYEGKLLNGKVFDSSYKRGSPAEFPLNRVIAGWSEGLQLMKVGSKFRFFIHSDLGYGSKGTQGIPPGSLLIFDVELLEIIKK